MGLTALLFMGGLGWTLIAFPQGRSLDALIHGYQPIGSQVLWGAAYGLVAGAAACSIIRLRVMAPTVDRYAWVGRTVRRPIQIVSLSLCAGIGEEILFRGAIQHWLGPYATALLFVLAHRYIRPSDRWLSFYGACLTVLIVPLGLMAARWGLVAPMAAHAMMDVVLFTFLALRA